MVESNLNNQESKGVPIKDITQSSKIGVKLSKRGRRKKSFFPFVFLVIFLGIWGFYGIYSSAYESGSATTSMEKIVPATNPVPIEVQEDIIIEFSDQIIPFNCKSFDYYDDYRPIEWNGNIKIFKQTEFDYLNRQGGGLLIIPEFYVFVEDNSQMAIKYEDDKRCYTDGRFFYNLTISGKTITNSYYFNMEDCYQIKDCNLMGHFNELMR